MQRNSITRVLHVCLFGALALGPSAHASAQSLDPTFCGMVSRTDGTIAGETISGRAARGEVVITRTLEAGEYLLAVALSATPTEAQLLPAERVSDDTPRIGANRIVTDFWMRTTGEVTLRFRVPRGTRYLVGFYLLPRPTENAFTLRPSATLENASPCRDCAPPPACTAPPNTLGLGGLVPRTR